MVSLGTERTPPSFPVICIGGSAGSLSAYIDILSHFPADAGFAVVIVSHRSAEKSHLLIKLLAKATRMKIVDVTDGMLLEAGRIFLAPPHREITTDGVVLKLALGLTPYGGWPTLISVFMNSMASMCASRAITVIVSRMGCDGSSALTAIKKAGGCTFAQSDGAPYVHAAGSYRYEQDRFHIKCARDWHACGFSECAVAAGPEH